MEGIPKKPRQKPTAHARKTLDVDDPNTNRDGDVGKLQIKDEGLAKLEDEAMSGVVLVKEEPEVKEEQFPEHDAIVKTEPKIDWQQNGRSMNRDRTNLFRQSWIPSKNSACSTRRLRQGQSSFLESSPQLDCKLSGHSAHA